VQHLLNSADNHMLARHVLTADELLSLETAWEASLPTDFHAQWSSQTSHDDRERREAAARQHLREQGLISDDPPASHDAARVEPHVGYFLTLTAHPTAMVGVQAWTPARSWMHQVYCDRQWGVGLTRARRPLPESESSAHWADEDAIGLAMGTREATLGLPLELLDHIRTPDAERQPAGEPLTVSLASSVAAVKAAEAGRDPDVAREVLRSVGADQSGEPFRSLARGIDAGFEITIGAKGSPVWHAIYVCSSGMWVSLATNIPAAMGTTPPAFTGSQLVDASTIRLTPVTASSIAADYLTFTASLPA
jgi:hypothetical protein